MNTRNLPSPFVILLVLLVAGCGKSPTSVSDSSQTALSQTATNSATSTPPPKNEAIIPAGTVNISGIELSQFLNIYKAVARVEIVTNRPAFALPPVLIQFENTNAVTRSELVRLMDQVLYDQARIVATHPDETHVVLKRRH